MPREIGGGQDRAGVGWCDHHIHRGIELGEALHQQRPGAIGLDVLHRRDEMRRAEGVGPGTPPLLHHLVVTIAASDFLERGCSLHGEDRAHRVGRQFLWPGDRREHRAGLCQCVEHRPLRRQRGALLRRRLGGGLTERGMHADADPGQRTIRLEAEGNASG